MFLVDSAMHAVPKARRFLATVHQYGPAIYEGLFKPMPRNAALNERISAEIQRTRSISVKERYLMHLYASQLLEGNTDVPTGMSDSLACRVRDVMRHEENHYRHMHPLRARRTKVAA